MSNDIANNFAKIILVIFGSLFLFVALALFFGGGALFFVTTQFGSDDGFLSTNDISFETTNHAIVLQPININLGNIGRYQWRPNISDFVTIKLSGTNNNSSKNIFIGIGRTSDVNNYLDGVAYSEVTDFSLFPNRVTYTSHSGNELPINPAQSSLLLSAHGSGTQSLVWAPEEGSYSIIMMNEDGSSNVDLDVNFMAKIPFLNMIMIMLFIGGIVALMFGGFLIYFSRNLSNQSRQSVTSHNVSRSRGVVFCSKCGTNMFVGDSFCQNCGEPQK